jgi:hypothetical protein
MGRPSSPEENENHHGQIAKYEKRPHDQRGRYGAQGQGEEISSDGREHDRCCPSRSALSNAVNMYVSKRTRAKAQRPPDHDVDRGRKDDQAQEENCQDGEVDNEQSP